MKSFLIFIVKIVMITGLLAVVLDYGYTAVYLNSKSRDKISDVFKSKARSYDVVILGSSRANNHFVTRIFEKNGLKTFNYGMSGGHLYEASLLLKLMIERNYEIENLQDFLVQSAPLLCHLSFLGLFFSGRGCWVRCWLFRKEQNFVPQVP